MLVARADESDGRKPYSLVALLFAKTFSDELDKPFIKALKSVSIAEKHIDMGVFVRAVMIGFLQNFIFFVREKVLIASLCAL